MLTPESSEDKRRAFVSSQLQLAIDAEVANDHKHALIEYGKGEHAVVDPFSPPHRGDQNWGGLYWYNPVSWVAALFHALREIWPTGHDRELANQAQRNYLAEFQQGVADREAQNAETEDMETSDQRGRK